MKEQNQIKRIGPDKGGHWEVVEELGMFISILVIVYCVVVLAVAYALKKYQRTILWSAGLLLFIVTMLIPKSFRC
jgi:hypothetical protein